MAIGIVEDNDDPLYKGRVKVRVFGKFDQTENDDPDKDFNIDTESLPWARPKFTEAGGIRGAGNLSIPKLGSIVNIEFEEGNEYAPIYSSYKCVSDDLIEEIKNSYKNAHVLLYDTVFGDKKNGKEYSNDREGEYIKIFFTEEKGLMFDYATSDGSTSVNIKPDNSLEIKTLDKGSVVIDKDGNITINNNGKTEIKTKGDTTINVDGNSSIETKGKTNIKSTGKTTVDSPNVEITGGEVKIGGKATPNSKGAFCGIPNCLFTGAPHVGDTIYGT